MNMKLQIDKIKVTKKIKKLKNSYTVGFNIILKKQFLIHAGMYCTVGKHNLRNNTIQMFFSDHSSYEFIGIAMTLNEIKDISKQEFLIYNNPIKLKQP